MSFLFVNALGLIIEENLVRQKPGIIVFYGVTGIHITVQNSSRKSCQENIN